MKELISKLREVDYDNLPHYTRIARLLIHDRISTFLSRLVCLWWGVKLGSNCSFVGVLHIARCRQSVIEIGAYGRFLSSVTSNLHGLDRPCMISTLKPNALIKIGSNVGMSGAVLCCATRVEIGDRVMVGANTIITDTDSHPLDYRLRHPVTFGMAVHSVETAVLSAPVIIEDDVFIGMHTLVLRGVTIGRGTVVGAGSVVSRSLPAYCIAAGNPAKPVRFFNESVPSQTADAKSDISTFLSNDETP